MSIFQTIADGIGNAILAVLIFIGIYTPNPIPPIPEPRVEIITPAPSVTGFEELVKQKLAEPKPKIKVTTPPTMTPKPVVIPQPVTPPAPSPTTINVIQNNNTPAPQPPAPQAQPEPEPKEVSSSQMGVWQIWEWQGNTLWIATAMTKVGDRITLTINNTSYSQTVESISGRNSIWSGFNIADLTKNTAYPATIKLERGNEFTNISFTIQ